MIPIASAPEAPPPRIKILDAHMNEVQTVRIGDKLTFRIEIPENSEFIDCLFEISPKGKKVEVRH